MSDQILYKCALLLLALKISSINSKIPSCELKTNDGQKIFICNRNTFLCSGNCSSLQPVSTLIYESFQHVQPECKHTCQRHCRTSKPWSSWTSEPLIGNSTTIRTRRRYCLGMKGIEIVQIHYAKINRNSTNSHRTKRNLPTKQTPLSPKLSEFADSEFRETFAAFLKYAGESVEFDCNTGITERIKRAFYRSVFRFIHNNKPMKNQQNENSGIFYIDYLKSTDEGVYLCQLEYEPNLAKTIAMFSILVSDNGNIIKVRKTEHLSLKCHSSAIAHFYPKAVRVWRDRTGAERYKAFDANKVGNDTFLNVNKTFDGQWICWVSDKETERTWGTSWYKVVVESPPTETERLVMTIKRYILTVITVCIGVIGFVLVMCVSVLHRGKKPKTTVKRKFKDTPRAYRADDVSFSTYTQFDSKTSLQNLNDKDFELDD